MTTITKDTLKNLSQEPGVYKYLDQNGKVLYIGKAKNLKKRINSYFKQVDNTLIPNPRNSQRIQIMISQAHSLHTTIVESEQDALILENTLIKQIKPKYNILLRDDKTYPYILLDTAAHFPRFEFSRQVKNRPHLKYFGPYPSGCRSLLKALYDLFPLVQKTGCLKHKKACLFYQINKCHAPCEGKITKQEYAKILDSALLLLQNKKKLLKALETKMLDCSNRLLFEKAKDYKEMIEAITPLANFSQINTPKPYNLDILYIAKLQQNNIHKAVLMKLFMRDGQITSSDFKILQHSFEISYSELFTQHILNHYSEHSPLPPDEILLPIKPDDLDLLESFLEKRQNKNIKITLPQIGFKKSLLAIAQKNAEEILRQNSEKTTSKDMILKEIALLLNLSAAPFRIEVFDTSHHSFTHNVGAMITYEDHDFIKPSYRHYNLNSKDEYSQMHEMLLHRIQSFDKLPPPDLWVLDGGAGQIKIAKRLLDSAGVSLDVIGIAKEKIDAKAHRAKGAAKDTIYYPMLRSSDLDAPLEITSLHLSSSDPRLQFLQKLRDEAHRFAISFHRKQKTKALTKTSYTKAQTKKLLDYFGSFKLINAATQEEIQSILKAK